MQLRPYQEEAVRRVLKFLGPVVSKGYICIPTGGGRSFVAALIACQWVLQKPGTSAYIFCNCQWEKAQMERSLLICRRENHLAPMSDSGITIISDLQKEIPESFEPEPGVLFIVMDPQRMDGATRTAFSRMENKVSLLGMTYTPDLAENDLFYGAPALYLWGNVGTRFVEYRYLEKLLIPILESQGYSQLEREYWKKEKKDDSLPDIVAYKEGAYYSFTFKAYRTMDVDLRNIQSAIAQVRSYRNSATVASEKKFRFGIIYLCRVDSQLKKAVWERERIFLWDIANLLYFCEKDPDLLTALSIAVPYALTGLVSEKPVYGEGKTEPLQKADGKKDAAQQYIHDLQSCPKGKQAAARYETIVTEILMYLFETEFSQYSAQHTTRDQMFRMDLLCSLKGSTAFWQTLIQFYRTKFVVFEYKNYEQEVTQNLVYVTEKYLFASALRNVAIIVSRNGFDSHARNAAEGILKESGKLMLSLKDEDLIRMIRKKQAGEEPSDYLLEQLENYLMGIGV